MRAFLVTVCLTALFAVPARSAAASTLGFEVLVNTAPLIGNAAGPFYLDFQLIGSGPNTVSINGFNFGGGSAVGPAFTTGAATGDLGSGIMLSDASIFFNELYERFTPGNTLSFFVTMTTNLTPTPDAFSFAILDGSQGNIPTTGLGDSLVFVNIVKSTLALSDVQTAKGLNVAGGPNYSSLTALAVPEPASLLLLGTGLAAVVAARRRQRSAK